MSHRIASNYDLNLSIYFILLLFSLTFIINITIIITVTIIIITIITIISQQRDGAGILVSRDVYEGIRQAQPSDVRSVEDIIRPFEEQVHSAEHSIFPKIFQFFNIMTLLQRLQLNIIFPFFFL
jgi:hypothetical protein